MAINSKMVTILGPTASGKTQVAIHLAQEYRAEIVCADSRTIYKGMDIGTAKPSIEEQRAVKHHLLDICEPNRPFSAAEFKVLAQKTILDIQKRGKLPLIVGGSGMYIDSILFDYKFRNDLSNSSMAKLSNYSIDKLQDVAKEKYPKEFNAIDIKNRRRLEQLIAKGPSKDDDRNSKKIDSLVIGIQLNNAKLKQNIELRTKNILSHNFIQEVEVLREKFGETDVLKQTTGYSQVLDYLNGNIEDLDGLYMAIVNATWQLSRKQITWFKRNNNIHWTTNIEDIESLVKGYL